MMEVRYKREMNRNYLIIEEPQEVFLEKYQLKMLEENPIEGLLRFYMKQTNEQREFYYEISSKQPLGRVLETRGISKDEIKKMILSISSTILRMESYLLESRQILLDAEYIYIEPSSFSISLCCIPGLPGDFPDALRRLLQYLINKVDYKDRDSVALVYQLYQESLKENYHMDDLLELLSSFNRKGELGERNINYELEKETMEKSRNIRLVEEQYELEEPEAIGITGWLKGLFTGKKEELKPRYVREKAIYEVKRENPPKPTEKENSATILISDLDENRKQMVILKSVFPESYQDIRVDEFPFTIGKSKTGVNHILNYPTVSRFHITIRRSAAGYEITDLNSTNGTIINDYHLEANETISLVHGDRVIIAGLEFDFYNFL